MEEHSNYNITVYKYVVSIHSLNKQDAQKNKILYSDHKHKRDGVEKCYVGIITIKVVVVLFASLGIVLVVVAL
jgi:hypothetical protein